MSLPKPGIEKICSVSTAPDNNVPSSSAPSVMTGVSAFRNESENARSKQQCGEQREEEVKAQLGGAAQPGAGISRDSRGLNNS